MSTHVLFRQIAMIFLEIGIGVLGSKLGIITDRDSKFLSNLVMCICLPATMLAGAGVESGRDTVLLMFESALLLEGLFLVEAVLCTLISRALHLSPGQHAVFIGVTVLPNSGFIGIPLTTAVLGEAAGATYGAAGLVAYNLFFFLYVVRLFKPGTKFEPKSLITPTNLSTLAMAAMLLAGVCLPEPLQGTVEAIGNCTTPLALMIVGVMLAGSNLRDLLVKPLLYLITALRCLAFPLVFMLVLWLLPLDRTLCMASAILAACPSGSLAAVLAKQHDLEGELASQAVTQSTVVIVVTLPVLLTLAGRLYGL